MLEDVMFHLLYSNVDRYFTNEAANLSPTTEFPQSHSKHSLESTLDSSSESVNFSFFNSCISTASLPHSPSRHCEDCSPLIDDEEPITLNEPTSQGGKHEGEKQNFYYEYLKGEIEFAKESDNINDIHISGLEKTNFTPTMVVLYETKLLFLPLYNHYLHTNSPNYNNNNNNNNNNNSSMINNNVDHMDNNSNIKNYNSIEISENINSNFHNIIDKKENIRNCDFSNSINTHELIHYGPFQSIDLTYAQIYSINNKHSTQTTSFINNNIEDEENYLFKIVYLYQKDKLENYYFKVKGEEEFKKWYNCIQKNIQFSLQQKKLLFQKTNFIFSSSNYTYFSTLQMRRSFRCYELPPRKKSCLDIANATSEEIIVLDNQFISAIVKKDNSSLLRSVVEKIISNEHHKIGEIVHKFLNEWKNERYKTFLSQPEVVLNLFIDQVKKFKVQLLNEFLNHFPQCHFKLSTQKQLSYITEDFIFEELYNITFLMYKSYYFERDFLYYEKMDTQFSGISVYNTGLSSYFDLGENGYRKAITCFQSITHAISPNQKLNILIETSEAISNCIDDYYLTHPLSSHSQSKKILSGDDLLPLFCYVIIKSNLPNLYSECKFLEDFTEGEFGEACYFLVTFRAALTLIYFSKRLTSQENWLILAEENEETSKVESVIPVSRRASSSSWTSSSDTDHHDSRNSSDYHHIDYFNNYHDYSIGAASS